MAFASLASLRLVGWEKQKTEGTASGLSVGLFGPNPSIAPDTKSCSIKGWLQARALLS